MRKRPPDASSQTKQQEPKSKTQQVKLPAKKLRLQKLNPENKNTIISEKCVRKRPADASLTKQQGPKSTSQPGSTITVLQCLTGCRIQCDRAHPTLYPSLPNYQFWNWNLNGIVYWGTQSIH